MNNNNIDEYLYQMSRRTIPYTIWHYIINYLIAHLIIKLIETYKRRKNQ